MLQPRGVVVQLVRIPACHAGGRGFEPRPLRQYCPRARVEKQTLKLFPTLIHYFKHVLSPEQLACISEHCLNATTHAHGAFVGEAQSTFGLDSRLIDQLGTLYPQLSGLKDGLQTLVDAYAEEMGFSGVKITNSWFNIQRPGSVLKHHVHPDSRVSAALCVVSDAHSSKLWFENPNPVLHLIRPDTYRESTFEMARFHLDPGDLVLFPSWIKHGSGFEPNGSELRLMISVNAM